MIALEQQLIDRLAAQGAAPWRLKLARWIESPRVVSFLVAVILVNAVVLGLETNRDLMARSGTLLVAIDKACLAIFIVEIICKLLAFRGLFWRSGWNVFDFVVVAVALVPGAGPWAIIRSLRVLRVLRLLTMIPSLRKVVAAFLHAIPGLGGVLLLMVVFLYTSAVLAVNLFGQQFPEWFGSLTASLFSLFQILTLEGWADMARDIMEVYPWAPLFFIPFIIIATFTVLNLFIGIIVSTMQELSTLPEDGVPKKDLAEALARIESDIQGLRRQIENEPRA
jgi:voltage-gated sodium channel